MDYAVIGLRIVGGLGAICLSIELIRVFLLVDHPRLRRIAQKLAIFFLVFAIVKLASIGLDSMIGEPLFGALVNNLLIFWLVWFIHVRRVNLKRRMDETDAREKIATSIVDILDEMKSERARIAKAIET